MENDNIERFLLQIGEILSEDEEYPLDRTLLFAKVDKNWASPSIYKDRGNHILFRWSMGSLTYPLLALWEEFEPGKRWVAMEYFIHDGQFDVAFTYPEEIDPQENPLAYRKRVVRHYFGDKPIINPTTFPDDDDAGQQFKL